MNYYVLKYDLEENYDMHYILSLFQLVSTKHCELLHLSYYDMIKKNKMWVIIKLKYQLNKKWKKGNYFIKTWPLDKRHFEYQREYQILDQNNEVYLIATAIWGLIDKDTRRITNDDVYLFDCLNYKNFQDRLKILKEFDKSEGKFIGEYEIIEENIDINGHVNNAEYPRIVEMFINKKVTKFEINYIKELLLGEKLYLYMKDDYIEGYKNDEVISFIAKLN